MTQPRLVRKKLYCSFCGHHNEEVMILIAGPDTAFICDECVGLCGEIVAQAREKRNPPAWWDQEYGPALKDATP